MKILDLTAFRAMPPGTIYSKYEPCYHSGLMVKGETLEHDFVELDLIGNLEGHSGGDGMEEAHRLDSGESVGLDFECYGRDGLFEKDQLFAVYEKVDVAKLVMCLMKAFEDGYSTAAQGGGE